MIIIGDTSLHFSSEKDMGPLNPSFHPDLKAALKYTYTSIENLGPIPERKYEGDVVFLIAENEAKDGKDVSKEWMPLLPNMKTIRINDNHVGLHQNPEYFDLYKQLILEHIN